MTTTDSNPEFDAQTHDTTASAERFLVLEPGRADRNYWRDLWFYRELFFVLAWRDVSIRYKQSVLGIAWAVMQPLMSMLIFTFVFGRIAKLPSMPDIPYPVMVYAGMLPWFLISTALSSASQSLVGSANMISKVYFPRLITPASSSIVALVDFLISLCVMFFLMLLFQVVPSWHIVFLPLFVLYSVALAFGPALLFASLNVRYRDFRFIIPFAVQFGLYVSPVGFSSSVVPEEWRLLYNLNPAVSAIDGFRWCLFGGDLYWPGLLVGFSVTVSFLWIGLRVFRRTERSFADLL